MNKWSHYKFIILLGTPLIVGIPSVHAQLEDDIQHLIMSDLGFEFDEDIDFESYENLLELRQEPIDLNTATYQQLQKLLVLSDFQIYQLLKHIEKFGQLYSIYELQSIPGFDRKTITTLLLFTTLSKPKKDSHHWKGYLQFRIQRLLQVKRGYSTENSEHRFFRNPYAILTKLRMKRPDKYALGITFESDAGEPIKWSPGQQWYGTGFYSAYFQFQSASILKNIVLGDFIANWGQGLVFGGGFSMGKGRLTTSTQKRVSTGIQPYKSTSEQGFMRGAGFTLKSRFLEISSLFSNTRIDANLNAEGKITSRILSGLHRSLTEMGKRRTVNEKSVGLNLNSKLAINKLNLGLSGVYTQFDRDFMPRRSPENLHKFSGRTNLTYGGYFEFRNKNYVLFGEVAANDTQKKGILLGGLATLSNSLETLFLCRNYDAGFNSLYGKNAFSESSLPENEKGIYWGLKYVLLKELTVSIYADVFSFPWLKRSVDSPSLGNDYMVAIDYNPMENFQMLAYYKSERKQVNTKEGGVNTQKSNLLKLDMKVDLNDKIRYSTGIWQSVYSVNVNHQKGTLVYSGLSYKINTFSFHIKAAITDAPDYQTRFYMYESDVLYSFNVPVYYGQNIRYNLLVKKKIFPKLTCWVKASSTHFRDRNEIGSGYDLIEGSMKSEIKFQAIYKL